MYFKEYIKGLANIV